MDFYLVKKLKFEHGEGVYIAQDHIGTSYGSAWDDYGYEVKFQVHALREKEDKYVGMVKILVKDENITFDYLKENSDKVGDDVFRITKLLKEAELVSLGTDLDFYRKLHVIFSSDEALISDFLDGISDLSYHYDFLNECEDWPGFQSSLLRSGSTSEAICRKGKSIALGRYEVENEFEVELNDLPESFDRLAFKFSNIGEVSKTNINILIGKNGVGKSHILSHLSDVVAGAVEIDAKWPYFHKLMVVAYSPFETFKTKKMMLDSIDRMMRVDKKTDKQKKKDQRRLFRVNEYSYIGFKNEYGKFDRDWPAENSAKSLYKVLEYDEKNIWWQERGRFEILFETLSLSIKFDSICFHDKNGSEICISKKDKLRTKTIKDKIDYKKGIKFKNKNQYVELSSGQLIYSYMIPALVAEIEKESLIIIDEPELYLHPAMEVGLIDMLKHLLDETSSYAILASHSALIAREVGKDGVLILRSAGERQTELTFPTIETYGESLDLIIGEAFDDYSTSKPYQQDLKKLIEKNDYQSPEQLLAAIGPNVGDEAIAYLLDVLEKDEGFSIEAGDS